MPIIKQYRMLKTIIHLYEKCRAWVTEQAVPVSQIAKEGIFESVIKMKYDIDNDQMEKFDEMERRIDQMVF